MARRGSPLPLIVLLLAAPCLAFSAPVGDVSLTVLPSLSIGLGPVVDGDLPLFGMGGGATLRGDFRPGFAPYLLGRAAFDFDFLPFNGAEGGLSVLSGGASLGFAFDPIPRLSLRLAGGGGLYMAMSDLGSVRNPFLEAGAEAQLRLSPTLGLGIGGRYRRLFAPSGCLYEGVSVQLGLGYDLAGARKGTELKMEPRLQPIFPLFYSYYDKNPAGEVLVTNGESSPYEKVSVSFYAKQYMDGPRLCAELGSLAGGETRKVPVYALFNDAIFRVTEGTKAAGEVIVDYYYLGKARKLSFPVTLQVQNRNAMSWDDDRKAAAFVTAKDPLVLGFAKNVASTVRYEGAPPVSEDFRTALALFQTLKLYGLGYAVDPKTPYTALSTAETAVDFLQFPNQTLSYRAGDCDDLSVLYAALLESVGVAAAFATTPGHIFVAFDTGLNEGAAKRLFAPQTLVVREGRAWVPVEVTLVKEGFVRAWRVGAQEWSQAEAAGQGGFYPVREAWKLYEPVGFVEGGIAVAIPSPERIVDGYRKEMRLFLDAAVGPRVAEALSSERASGRSAEQAANRVGILYAQFGLLDKAEEQFRTAAKKGGYAPALTNLGNALYLKGDMKGAYEQYARALAIAPDSAVSLSGAARALYALQDYEKMNKALDRLRVVSPELAAKIDLQGGAVTTARASEAVSRKVDAWDE